jgi:hypothetical protein
MAAYYLPANVEIGVVDNSEELEAKVNRARRNRIAEGFAFALASGGYRHDILVSDALDLADALIAGLDK